jgi:alpha-tubulin suppressor-like RCC1 family protein
MPVVRTTGAERVSIGVNQACVLDVGGAARCSSNGQPGEPLAVAGGIAFSELALAGAHTCGLDRDANAYCWGAGNNGELGTGMRVSSVTEPTAVAGGHHFVSIGARDATTCGATDTGALLCWGVLGDDGVAIPGASRCGTTYQDKSGPVTYYVTCALSPLRIPVMAQGSDTTFVSVSGTCALSVQGSVYCSRITHMERVAPPGSFVAIASGPGHTCGLAATGEASCWGQGFDGQRGGTTTFSSVPVTVAGSHSFVRIAVGESHTCGLAVAGDVWCWGNNWFGQAGVPMRSDTRVPRRVRGQP